LKFNDKIRDLKGEIVMKKEYKVVVNVSNTEEEDSFDFYVEAESIEEAVDNIMDELDM
jgi:hypothetical protein